MQILHKLFGARVDKRASRLTPKVAMHVVSAVRADHRILRSAHALADAGYRVEIVDVESGYTGSSDEVLNGLYLKHVIMPASFASTRFERGALIKAAQLFLRSLRYLLRTQADIYHAHDVPALPACYLAALLHRKQLIFDAHELPLADRPLHVMSKSRRLLQHLLGGMLQVMLTRCAKVITVSAPIAQEMCQRYHLSGVELVRNVPVYQAVSRTKRLQDYLGLAEHTRIALYQGNIQADRGLDKLVRAAAFLEQDIVIVMMGKGMGSTPAELQALIETEKVAQRVRLIPPAPYKELLEWTASAHLGLTIIPLDYTLNMRWCLPNKFFEYLMAGLPVLTSPLDAIVEIVEGHKVGAVVDSYAPATIGLAINRLLADPLALEQMHRNALIVAQQEFCWNKERQHLLKLYQDSIDVFRYRVQIKPVAAKQADC